MWRSLYSNWNGRNARRKQREEDSLRVIRSCDTILKELHDHNEALNTRKYTHTIRKEHGIYYKHRYLNTSAFDNILYSGLFTHFDAKTQIQVSNLYLMINLRNETSLYKFKFQDMFFIGDVESPEAQSYYNKSIVSYEQYLTLLEKNIRETIATSHKIFRK